MLRRLVGGLQPELFCAQTSTRYAVPLVRPLIVQVVLVVVHWPTKLLFDARYALTAYRLIVAPPLLADAVQVTVAEPLPATTDGDCGADGTVGGRNPGPTYNNLFGSVGLTSKFTNVDKASKRLQTCAGDMLGLRDKSSAAAPAT